MAAPKVAGVERAAAMLGSDDIAEAIEAPRAAHWGFWGTLIWGAVILIIGCILQIVALFAVVLRRYGDIEKLSGSELAQVSISTSDSGLGLSVVTFLTTVVGGGLVIGVIKLKRDSVLREYLCIKPVSLATMRNWLGLLGGLLIIEELLAIALGHSRSEFMSVAYATANPVWLLWIAIVIAAPLFEETLFRGFLLKGFAASFMGPIGAVIVTSGVCGAARSIRCILYGDCFLFRAAARRGTTRHGITPGPAGAPCGDKSAGDRGDGDIGMTARHL
jgi:membrane protease YdiL (CAAX protease family)